jgi:ribosomal protein S18 acetylase RimI-like enzyme
VGRGGTIGSKKRDSMNVTVTPERASIPQPRVRIDSGRWTSIRPIERSDAPALFDFYAALSPESIRRRFLGARQAATTGLVRTFVERAETGLIATVAGQGPDDGVIVGHAAVLDDGRGGAEIAIAVADQVQGFGIGRALMTNAVALARQRGAREVSASLFADNVPMLRLLRGAGCTIRSDTIDVGVEEISLDLRAAV